jgi:hypothetical protein
VKKMPKPKGDFAKGAMRFKKLRSNVEGLVPAGETLRWWFIGTGASARAVNSMRPSLLLSSEQVFAVTDQAVHVIPLSGPGVFSSKLQAADVRSVPVADVDVSVDPAGQTVSVDDVTATIYLNHDYEALQFAAACGADMPEWFVPA